MYFYCFLLLCCLEILSNQHILQITLRHFILKMNRILLFHFTLRDFLSSFTQITCSSCTKYSQADWYMSRARLRVAHIFMFDFLVTRQLTGRCLHFAAICIASQSFHSCVTLVQIRRLPHAHNLRVSVNQMLIVN